MLSLRLLGKFLRLPVVFCNSEFGHGFPSVRVDIMAQTAAQLDIAYAKIQKWCSFEFHKLGKDLHPEVQPVLCESVRRLRIKRPEALVCVPFLSWVHNL